VAGQRQQCQRRRDDHGQALGPLQEAAAVEPVGVRPAEGTEDQQGDRLGGAHQAGRAE